MKVKFEFDGDLMIVDVSEENIWIPNGDTFNPRNVKIVEIRTANSFQGTPYDDEGKCHDSSWWRLRDKGYFIASRPGSFQAAGFGRYRVQGDRVIAWGR